MTKRYDDPIDVDVGWPRPDRQDVGWPRPDRQDNIDPVVDDAPVAFRWRGTRYEVDQRLDSWREAGQWWATAEATEREYFRVLARPSGTLSSGEVDADGFLRTNGAVYDVYRDRFRGDWRLARIWD